MSIAVAKGRLSELAVEAKALMANDTLDVSAKRARMSGLEAEMKELTGQIAAIQQAQQWMSGANSASYTADDPVFMSSTLVGGLSERLRAAGKSVDQVNPYRVGPAMLAEMHRAVTGHKSFRAEIGTKTPLDFQSDIPAQLGAVVPLPYEPLRIASLFPNRSLGAPSIEYVRITGVTNDAAAVAAGGTKPNLGITHENVTATAVKIAAVQDVLDESLSDFPLFSQVVTRELQRALFSAENTQLLSGNGTPPNMQGLLGTSNILTRAMTSAGTNLDVMEQAIEDLRTGSSYAEPDMIVMHPKDWGAIRRAKASTSGVYLAVDPLSGSANTLWGVPVRTTTDISQGTAVVGAFAIGGEVAVREPLRLDTDFGRSGDGFTSNVTTFRAEERLVLQVYRPTCFVKVTGLSAT